MLRQTSDAGAVGGPRRSARAPAPNLQRLRDLVDSDDDDEELDADGEPVDPDLECANDPDDDARGEHLAHGEEEEEDGDDDEGDDDDDEAADAGDLDEDEDECNDVPGDGDGLGTDVDRGAGAGRRPAARKGGGGGRKKKVLAKDAKFLDPWSEAGASNGVAASVTVVVVDIETTGSNKSVDRMIALGVTIYVDQRLVGTYEQRYSNQGVSILKQCLAVHGISVYDLRAEPRFEDVVVELVAFLNKHLQPESVGVLVAHNGDVCDFPFLFYEFRRAGATFPEQIRYTLDTLSQLRVGRGLGIGYETLSADAWPTRTKTGKPALKLAAIVDYLLKPDGSSFADACGDAHDALADARGAAIILHKALWAYRDRRLCRPVADWLARAMEIASKPAVAHEPVASGWQGGEPVVPVPAPPPPTDAATAPPPSPAAAPASDIDTLAKTMAPSFDPPRGRTPGPSRALKAEVRGACGSVPALLLALFDFFFPNSHLEYIAICSNAYATQDVVVERRPGRRDVLRARVAGDPQDMPTRPRRIDWAPLSVAELTVFIGILLKAGVSPRRRIAHYWSTINGFRDEDIASAMTLKRFLDVYAVLTFRMSDDVAIPNDKLWKIRTVVDAVCARFREGLNPSQTLAIDESMLKSLTKYNPTSVMMPSKPIKQGTKVWVVGDSEYDYVYGLEIFQGGDGGGPGAMHRLINRLVDASFDNTGTVIFMDALFTSIALFEALASRGIYAVGPLRAGRPKTGAGAAHWPFQTYGAGLLRLVPRGWLRTATRTLSCGAALGATVWRDNRFVTLLYTAFASTAPVTLDRWHRDTRRRQPVQSFLALAMYSKRMGAVDRVDKNISYSSIRLKHCAKRYHRSIWFWLLSAAWNNIFVLFEVLYEGDVAALRTTAEMTLGFKTWLQYKLAVALLRRGASAAFAVLSVDDRGRGKTPAFMPVGRGRRSTLFSEPAASAVSKKCRRVHGKEIHFYDAGRQSTGTLGFSHCKVCYEMAVKVGPRTMSSGRSNRVMPKGHHREGKRPAQTVHGCKGCKINICSDACFEAWDHANNCLVDNDAPEVTVVCAAIVKPYDKKRRRTAP